MAKAVLAAAPHGDPEAIKVLTKGSLVDIDGADYRLLWTIRAAAQRQLGQDPALHREAKDALATWAAAYGEERYQVLTAHEDIPDDTLLAVEGALEHGLDVGFPGLGRAMHCFEVAVLQRGPGAAARALARRSARITPVDRDSVTTVAAAVHLLEHLEEDSGVDTQTFEAMKHLASRAADWRLLVDVLHGQALHEGNLGRWAQSLALWHEALPLAERHVEARHELPGILGNLSFDYYYAGDRARSIEYAERSLASAIELDIRHVRVVAHTHLGDWALIEDRREDARDHALAALREAPPTHLSRAVALGQLARALNRLGDPESALAAGRQALELFDAQPTHHLLSEGRELLLAELPELRT